jgi:hypothetical protein
VNGFDYPLSSGEPRLDFCHDLNYNSDIPFYLVDKYLDFLDIIICNIDIRLDIGSIAAALDDRRTGH